MRFASAILTLVALAGLYLATKDYPRATDAEPFHERVKQTFSGVGERLGDWTILRKIEPPPAAFKLLRPNAILTMELIREVDSRRATLILVQCKDSRDMAGHYPPNCYPAHGWTKRTVSDPTRELLLNSRKVRVEEYEFGMARFEGDEHVRIFNFFALPMQEFVPDIRAVRAAAENYRLRPYGATQVQVVIDGRVPVEEARLICADVLNAAEELLDVIAESGPQRGMP